MKPGRILIGLGYAKNLRLTEQLSNKRDRDRRTIRIESIRQNHRRMTREIGQEQDVAAKRRRDEYVDLLHHLVHLLHDQRADPIGLQVLDSWNETRLAE